MRSRTLHFVLLRCFGLHPSLVLGRPNPDVEPIRFFGAILALCFASKEVRYVSREQKGYVGANDGTFGDFWPISRLR